jgi:hypothetical protein
MFRGIKIGGRNVMRVQVLCEYGTVGKDFCGKVTETITFRDDFTTELRLSLTRELVTIGYPYYVPCPLHGRDYLSVFPIRNE